MLDASVHAASDVSNILSRKSTADLHVSEMLYETISAFRSGMICEEERDRIIESAIARRWQREEIVSVFREKREPRCCTIM